MTIDHKIPGSPARPAGFTLIELALVAALLSVLAAIAIPKFAGQIVSAQEASTKGNLGVIRSALSIYYGDVGAYPVQLNTLTIGGRYLSKIPTAIIPPNE